MDNKEPQKTDDNQELRVAGSTVGGMLLAGSLFGPVGAIVGGALGFFLGKTVTEEEKAKDKEDHE